jgi:hypothetical protein
MITLSKASFFLELGRKYGHLVKFYRGFATLILRQLLFPKNLAFFSCIDFDGLLHSLDLMLLNFNCEF